MKPRKDDTLLAVAEEKGHAEEIMHREAETLRNLHEADKFGVFIARHPSRYYGVYLRRRRDA
jgi:hypothetical protein